MKLKMVYLVLCLLGAVLPYSQFVPWLTEHGRNARLFVEQLFVTSSVWNRSASGFFTPGWPHLPFYLWQSRWDSRYSGIFVNFNWNETA